MRGEGDTTKEAEREKRGTEFSTHLGFEGAASICSFTSFLKASATAPMFTALLPVPVLLGALMSS
jgi:hypothetical protein